MIKRSSRMPWLRTTLASLIPLALLGLPLSAQLPVGSTMTPLNTSNVKVVAHVPLEGPDLSTSDIDIEQELSRPFAYVGKLSPAGFVIVNLKDPEKADVIWSWHIDNPDLHLGLGGLKPQYFKRKGHYYVAIGLQFMAGGPDADLGCVIFDVTGLPDVKTIKEVARVHTPDTPGGFHDIFAYRHSDGRALMFATTTALWANVYDLDKLLAGDKDQGLIGKVPVPDNPYTALMNGNGYHDFYVAYDPGAHQDKFYGPGVGGYWVFDVSTPEKPRLITGITGVQGVNYGHTFTPSPDGRFAVTETEYQYAPLRMFDLKPGLDGTVKTISNPIGAWSPNWEGLAHNHEVRWPYVFVSALQDGLQIFTMMDPAHPKTVGFYRTAGEAFNRGLDIPSLIAGHLKEGESMFSGAWGVDIRNADGLVVLSDFRTGFWAFRMDGFSGWNGHKYGQPNVSSAQDWDNGPEGVPKKQVTMR